MTGQHHQDPAPETRERPLAVDGVSGRQAARDRLVERHMPAIRAMARQYRRHPRIDEDDLVQAGVVGLLRAVERFDPAFDTPLWAYATWWVRSDMQQVVAELSCPCVLSDRALRGLARMRAAEGRDARRDPATAAAEDIDELSRPQVQALRAAGRPARSLDEPVGPDAESTIGDLIGDPCAEEPSERAVLRDTVGRVNALIRELEPRERRVLRERFPAAGGSRTLGDLGDELGVSAERVRQIEAGALSKLRAALC